MPFIRRTDLRTKPYFINPFHKNFPALVAKMTKNFAKIAVISRVFKNRYLGNKVVFHKCLKICPDIKNKHVKFCSFRDMQAFTKLALS